jgi:hypothetical protein
MTTGTVVLPPSRIVSGPSSATAAPLEPATAAATGLAFGTLQDLVLKAVASAGQATPADLAERLCLPVGPLQEVVHRLRSDARLQVARTAGPGEHLFVYELTDAGAEAARRAAARNGYAGPAPVSLDSYEAIQRHQPALAAGVTRERLLAALAALVFPPPFIEALGAAVMSRRSLLLAGAPGNGKSAVAAAMRHMLSGVVYVPYAIDVDGQTVAVFDERTHDQLGTVPRGHDRRFVPCAPPLVTLGGELTFADLDLRYSDTSRFYAAPPALRANGGILVIDDLGRQQLSPQELLNRWVRALDTGRDSLHLQNGQSVSVPFDFFLVLSTNLRIADLGDEAFLRRIRHKLLVPGPTADAYREILRRACTHAAIAYDANAADALLARYYDAGGRELRGSHPADIVAILLDQAAFKDQPPACTRESLFAAADAYFAPTA